MICKVCRKGRHTLCVGGNWCDCQHKPRRPPAPAAVSDIFMGVRVIDEMKLINVSADGGVGFEIMRDHEETVVGRGWREAAIDYGTGWADAFAAVLNLPLCDDCRINVRALRGPA
jgi:hypothetical protein